MSASPPKVCVLIPAFREEYHIADVVREALDYCPNVIVIDDGSPDNTATVAAAAGAHVLSHVRNQGKGAALQTGFEHACANGFDLIITMDADGQHAPSDIPAFIAAWERTRSPVYVGNRMGDLASMPWVRRHVNRYMSRLLSRVMGQYVPDSQCGFRLYHASALPPPLNNAASRRYAAESEILLHLALQGRKIGTVAIQTIYGAERSKVNPLTDTFRFYRMLHRFKKIKREYERKR